MARNKAIPKKIHYVWVGGDIPEKYLRNIKTVAALAARSGIEVNLWVDNESNYNHVIAKDFNLAVPNLKIRNIHELDGMVASTTKEQRTAYLSKDYPENHDDDYRGPVGAAVVDAFTFSAEDERALLRYAQHEMVGSTNYAAASDILRLLILYHEGGYYFDTDLFARLRLGLGKSSIELPAATEGFVFISLPAEHAYDIASDLINSAMGSAQHHDVVMDGLLLIKKAYDQLYEGAKQADFRVKPVKIVRGFCLLYEEQVAQFDPLALKRMPGGFDSDRMHLTIQSSGPNILREMVRRYLKMSGGQRWNDGEHSNPLIFSVKECPHDNAAGGKAIAAENQKKRNQYEISLGRDFSLEVNCDMTWLETGQAKEPRKPFTI